MSDSGNIALLAHEKYVADSHAMDAAFANGTLEEWVNSQQAQAMKEFTDVGGTAPEGNRGTAAE